MSKKVTYSVVCKIISILAEKRNFLFHTMLMVLLFYSLHLLVLLHFNN